MGLRIVLFTLGFNALLWLAVQGLVPIVPRTVGDPWLRPLTAVLAPVCLLAIFLRLRMGRAEILITVSCLSLVLANAGAGLHLS